MITRHSLKHHWGLKNKDAADIMNFWDERIQLSEFSEDDIAKAMGNGGSGGGNDDSKSKIAVDDDEKYDWL